MVNFVAVVAYHFCLALPAAVTQPGVHLIAEPCTIAIVTHAAQSVAIRISSFGSLRTIVKAIATNAANAIMILVVANNFPVLTTI